MALDLWYLRASQGYSGGGAKPTGYEHHVVAKHGKAISVTSEVEFHSYGHQHYEVTAKGAVQHPEARFESHSRGYTISSNLAGSTWRGEISGAEPPSFGLAVGDGADILPSTVARFLPVWLPREEGEVARYVVVPEDGYPAWRPPGKDSNFPLLIIPPGERVVVGRGEEMLPRAVAPAFRYDHLAGDEVVATTWVDAKGRPVAFEQPGLVLLLAREEDARATLRRP